MPIDFHTHILPGIDDGSRNVEMSLRMLAAQREQQVNEIVATLPRKSGLYRYPYPFPPAAY